MQSASPRSSIFYDGKTSIPIEVRVRLHVLGLELLDATDKVLRSWDYADLRNIEEVSDGLHITLCAGENNDEQLVVDDIRLVAALLEKLPKQNRKGTKVPLSVPLILVFAILSVAAIIAVVYGMRHVSTALAQYVPFSVEKAIGEALVPQLDRARDYAEKYPCRNEVNQRYLRKIITTLDATNKLPKEIQVLVDPDEQVNAFALPGNIILVNQGLLDFAKTDMELVGVIAHEIGHLEKNHVMQSVVHDLGLQILLTAMTGSADALGQLGTTGAQIYALGYSRDHEREADEVAVKYLQNAGLSTNSLALFFTRIEAEEGVKEITSSEFFGYISSHPLMKERIAILEKGYAKQGFEQRRVLTGQEFEVLKNSKALECPVDQKQPKP